MPQKISIERVMRGPPESGKVAIHPAQQLAEICRQSFVGGIHVDDLIALDDAKMQFAVGCKARDFH